MCQKKFAIIHDWPKRWPPEGELPPVREVRVGLEETGEQLFQRLKAGVTEPVIEGAWRLDTVHGDNLGESARVLRADENLWFYFHPAPSAYADESAA